MLYVKYVGHSDCSYVHEIWKGSPDIFKLIDGHMPHNWVGQTLLPTIYTFLSLIYIVKEDRIRGKIPMFCV